jgi:hypothetical protein
VYDSETKLWDEQHIRVFPALGNHDLHGDLNASLANYFQRYPALKGSLRCSRNKAMACVPGTCTDNCSIPHRPKRRLCSF